LKELSKRLIFGALFVIILVVSAQHQYALSALFFVFGIICLKEFNLLIEQRNTVSYAMFSILYGVFAFWDILTENNKYSPENIIGIFALIWINDSFAYLIGKNFGRQKLFESVSPKKTVEGFLAGVFFSAIGSYIIFKLTDNLLFSKWLILSVIVSVFGTIGDLIESKYKRQAEVKDSGTLIPGHGGLLDRLDSAIFVAPFIYLFLRILNYVS